MVLIWIILGYFVMMEMTCLLCLVCSTVAFGTQLRSVEGVQRYANLPL